MVWVVHIDRVAGEFNIDFIQKSSNGVRPNLCPSKGDRYDGCNSMSKVNIDLV